MISEGERHGEEVVSEVKVVWLVFEEFVQSSVLANKTSELP